MKLIYKDGDITNCEEIDKARENHTGVFIVHCCNDIKPFACMGAGVALAIIKKWPQVKKEYDLWAKSQITNMRSAITNKIMELGHIQIVAIDNYLSVVNLIGQRGVSKTYGMEPIRYEAIKEGFLRLKNDPYHQIDKQNEIVIPRIGCALAGGSWTLIETILKEVFAKTDIKITVYTMGDYNK